MVAQTFVSLHLYGYGAVLATIQTLFTTDGRRPRSNTRFYNGFGVDSNVYDYRRHTGLALPEVRGTAEPTIGNTRVSVAYYSFYNNIQLYEPILDFEICFFNIACP